MVEGNMGKLKVRSIHSNPEENSCLNACVRLTSESIDVRLGLEGGKQVSLGFLIVSRVWFGIIFVPPLFVSLITFICLLQLL